MIKTIPKKKKGKKVKWLSEEALQIAEKRREAKCKGEEEIHTHLNAEFQRIARRDKKAFLSEEASNSLSLGEQKWELKLFQLKSLWSTAQRLLKKLGMKLPHD